MDSLTITDEIIEKMNVYNLRNFLLDRGVTIANYHKADLIVFAKAALKMKLSTNVDFNDDAVNLSDRLTIKGKILPDPFSIPAEDMSRSLENTPPFGMEDIFNFLIFKSSEYDRHKIASYKAFEDYGLFEDGHVEDVKVKEVEGHFIFVGKVKPTMKSVTNEGENFYKVWFVIDGDREAPDSNSVAQSSVASVKWKPTAGSVFSAYCLCPGGQDGACKHVAACLYSVHDCLYPSTGPTDELCYWKKKEGGKTQPTPVSNVRISKPSTIRRRSTLKQREELKKLCSSRPVKKKQRKDREPPLDKISYDPRPPYDRSQRTEDELKEIKKKLAEFGCVAGYFVNSDSDTEACENNNSNSSGKAPCKEVPFIYGKVQSYINSGQTHPKAFLDSLQVSAKELEDISNLTKEQGDVWLTQRKGLLTSTKLQAAYTRQTTLDKDPSKDGKSTASRLIASDSLAEKYGTMPIQIQYGNVHENEARKHYKKYMSDTHKSLCVKSSGLVINQDFPYIAASPDDLRSCACCMETLIEYKCPFTNRDKHPKEAFLDKNVGGVCDASGNFTLKKNHRYYFQVQGGMAATGTQVCDFVVYTMNTESGSDGGIFVTSIPFCKDFWEDVLSKVSRFYLTWMLPLIFQEITSKACNDAEMVQEETTPCSDVVTTEMVQEETTPCNDVVTTESFPVKYVPAIPSKSVPITNVNTSSETQKVSSVILGVPVFEDDLTCLLGNKELNDTMVVIFTRKLLVESPHLENVVLPDSIFFLSLSQNSLHITQCEKFERASRFVKTLGPHDTLVVPICENTHWYVIVINSSCAVVMDSLSNHVITKNRQITLICKFLNWRNPNIVYARQRHVLRVPQQTNSTDCGVYLILNLMHFFKPENYFKFIEDGEKFCFLDHTNWFTQEDIAEQRRNMRLFIVKNIFS